MIPKHLINEAQIRCKYSVVFHLNCCVIEIFPHSVAVMAARALSVCVGQGQVTQQVERVLLDASVESLKVLTEQENITKQAWMTKRCQALSALIRLSRIATSRELLDLQLKVCHFFTRPPQYVLYCLFNIQWTLSLRAHWVANKSGYELNFRADFEPTNEQILN